MSKHKREDIWRQRSGSTLAQVMACCLTAPSVQAITWSNVDWSSLKSSDRHIKAISLDMPQPSITKICLKITYLKFHSNFLGGNELIKCVCKSHALFALPSGCWLKRNWMFIFFSCEWHDIHSMWNERVFLFAVCQEFLVREDGALAHRLQEEECTFILTHWPLGGLNKILDTCT